ncbi:MAG: Stp1/IreP family PP2C-type Ser/Thr phosphatase [Candidatus Symbiothrix sp.]|jgi:serine/threonine protein phosphatase PrpC/predicted DNA-binding protein YlxM (UPF0122 family)|nr:Stp1/IreP family PP2C-type Ser/Thr phosphatase [Candidatus Symbiothrix sp.]
MKLNYIADFSLCSNVGLVRQKNEDNCGYALRTPNGDLFVVCDGMGGHVGGATASKIGVEKIIEYFQKENYSNPQQALVDALTFANAQILGTAMENPELKGMGTTACVVLIQGDEAWIAHAGDSRIYLYVEKDELLHRITTDHSYVQKVLVEQEHMSEEEAERHPKKNIILNALGIKADFKPEVISKPILPAKGDIFLICSDGLTGMVDDPTIEEVLEKDTFLKDKVEELIDLAIEGGGKDNITAQLIQIIQSPHPKSVFADKNPEWRKKKTSQATGSKQNNKVLIITVVAIVLVALAVAVHKFYEIPIPKQIQKLELQKEALKEPVSKAKKDLEDIEEKLNALKKDSVDAKLTWKKSIAEKMVEKAEKKYSKDTIEINTKINSLRTKL